MAVGSRGAEGGAAPPDGGQGICTSTRLNGNTIQIQQQHFFGLKGGVGHFEKPARVR